MKNTNARLKSFIKAYEDLKCLRLGIKPYLTKKSIRVLEYTISSEDRIINVIYDYAFNSKSKYIEKLYVDYFGAVQNMSILRDEV